MVWMPIFLFLFFLGFLGLFLLNSGIKNLKQNKRNRLYILKIFLGSLSLAFVIYNWVGHNSIFSENEKLLIGVYKCDESILTVNSDYTWNIKESKGSIIESGYWEYVMSEDWCYWNIESDSMWRKFQLGHPVEQIRPNVVVFKEQNLNFKRIK